MLLLFVIFPPHNSHRGNLSGIWRQAGKHHLRASVNTQTHLSLVFTRLRTADTFGGNQLDVRWKIQTFFCTLCPVLEIFFSFLLTDSISGDRDFNQANKIICLRQKTGNKRNFEALPSYISCNLHCFTVPHRQHAFRQPSFNLVPMHLLLFMAKRITFYFRESILHLRGISLN